MIIMIIMIMIMIMIMIIIIRWNKHVARPLRKSDWPVYNRSEK